MPWTLSDSRTTLRRRLRDSTTDKYVHQIPVDPSPNGTYTVFAVPDSHLVVDSVRVFIDGQLQEDGVVFVYVRGSFELEAPDEGRKLVASYYFQWFTDEQIDGFLQDGAQLLRFETVEDTSMPIGLRTPLTSLAAYYAYMSKAAESAPALLATTAGFTSDTSKEHPYWMDLAKMAFEMFEKELETFNENSALAVKPAMSFVTFRLQRYVPRT